MEASVLIISSAPNASEIIARLVKETGLNSVCVLSGSEARRLLITANFDAVVINAPLRDEFGVELAIDIADKCASGIVLIVKNEIEDEVAEKVEDSGVFVVGKPLAKNLFFSGLRMAVAAHRRVTALSGQTLTLKSKIEEMRLIDRAKCRLIEERGMTEAQAHRYIEKAAMDSRETKVRVATRILGRSAR